MTLAIFDDRLEISNPEQFPKPLASENIKEPHGSYPYNLRIAQVLFFSKYIEQWGTQKDAEANQKEDDTMAKQKITLKGLDRSLDELVFPEPAPAITITGPSIVVTASL